VQLTLRCWHLGYAETAPCYWTTLHEWRTQASKESFWRRWRNTCYKCHIISSHKPQKPSYSLH
jgi:hypothetical protein